MYVCPSVCLSRRPPHAADTSLLLWARQPGDIDRLLHGRLAGGQQQLRRSGVRRPHAGSATLSADVGS